MSFLTGKRIFITGVASERSIAWGIAQAMARQGAELAFSYQGDKLRDRVARLAEKVESDICVPLDVSSDQEIEDAIGSLRERWDRIDGLVHSIGYAPRELLNGSYIDSVTREGFQIAHDISSYSFAALAKAARPAMTAGSSLLTLSYLGAVRSIPNYNVMGPAKASLEANIRFMAADLGPEGIRVNGISAGPIKTLAASGVKNFRALLAAFERVAPLRRVVTTEEVGNAAAFLCSDLAAGITGEIMYVDGGFNITAMVAEH